jgi:hypothetical protein
MPYTFFVSYARADNMSYRGVRFISKFFEDLEAEIRLTYNPNNDLVFFDNQSIEHGAIWTEELEGSLKTCKIFIPLYSLTYFTRQFCGKEWSLFEQRVIDYKNSNGLQNDPRVIFPVLLCPPNFRFREVVERLPDRIRNIQYAHGDYPNLYNSQGLARMFGLARNQDDYMQFISTFADKLVEAIENCSLPPYTIPIDIMTTPSAFPDIANTEAGPIQNLQQSVQTPGKAEGIGPERLIDLNPQFGI